MAIRPFKKQKNIKETENLNSTMIKSIIIIAFLFVAAIAVTICMVNQKMVNFDKGIIDFIRSFSSTWLTLAMMTITDLASKTFLIPAILTIVAIFAVIRKKYSGYIMIAIVPAVGWLIGNILKDIFRRPRPDELRLVVETGFSYPSNHSLVGLVFYGFLAYFILVNTKARLLRRTAVSLAIILVFFIGISRIYLGVHYPSDVLGGYLIGGIWLTLSILLHRAISRQGRA